MTHAVSVAAPAERWTPLVVKPGRTLAVTRGEVHAEQGGARTRVARMPQALMAMHGKKDS